MMPEQKNCLSCRWEPEWKEEERPSYDDNGYACGSFIGYFATDCNAHKAFNRAQDTLPSHCFIESFGLEKRGDRIFVDGPDHEITDCPAWQPKEES